MVQASSRTMRHNTSTTPFGKTTPVAAASLICALLMGTDAQAESPAEINLPEITVNAPKDREANASISGLGSTPAWQSPVQASRYSSEALKAAQIRQLADLTKLDASITDSYNAAGYWDFIAVRGFTLDNTHNYRRDGLPINTETSIALDNKSAIEVFKGTSGIQAGMSSPGGLINYVVKRPDGHLRTAELAVSEHGDILTAIDLSERFGPNNVLGARLNVANERLNSAISNTKGNRQLVALASDIRLTPDTLLEAEIEYSRRSQHSVPGFSMLGTTLPLASTIDRNLNLNNQPWAAPVVMQGTTGSVRLTQSLADDWKLVGHYGEQRLRSDDRAAFPFGGTCRPADGYANCDRYAEDGSFAVYDYRSAGEIRVTRALDVNASGTVRTGTIGHELTAGVLRTLTRVDLPTAMYNDTGATGTVYGDFLAEPSSDAAITAQNDRTERSTEVYLRDSLRLSEAWRAWAGMRHTQISRTQTLSDLSQPSSRVSQSMTTPWAALGYEWAPMRQVYASWGEGIELLASKFSIPGSTFTNSGEVLPAAKSRQWELGMKGQSAQLGWSIDWFHIVRPEARSVFQGTDDNGYVYTYQRDGESVHQGLEGQMQARVHAWTINASAMVLDAKLRNSSKEGFDGKAPANVPDYAIKLAAAYRVATLPGLTLQGDVVTEGPRTVDVSNDVRLSAWTRLDASVTLAQRWSSNAVTWRLGITNLLDTKAWREAPTQFDHIYLIPMAGRAVTVSAQLSF
jgi:iron complex outermembrane receptor protein